jgi:helix-turn-helix protein/RDD family protein
MTVNEPAIGDLMRRARLSRGVALVDVARTTRIDIRMLEHMDAGRFDCLPPGVYARAWIRAYAAEIGLDPADLLSRIDSALPRVDEDLVKIVHVRDQASGSGSRLSASGRSAAAAATDALILLMIDAAFVLLAAAACRVGVRQLIDAGWVPFATMFVIFAALYFVIFAGAGGRTPGAVIFSLPVDDDRGPIDLRAAGRRGARCFLAEASLLFGLR